VALLAVPMAEAGVQFLPRFLIADFCAEHKIRFVLGKMGQLGLHWICPPECNGPIMTYGFKPSQKSLLAQSPFIEMACNVQYMYV
jgi:hypothetical protein